MIERDEKSPKELFGKKLLFLDGAMGTELQAEGLKIGEVPDIWNITHAELVRGVHRRYLAAGSDIIITNTFGCNALKLQDTGFTVKEVAEHAVGNAKAAIASVSRASSKPRFTALDIGPTGKLLKPLGDLPFEEAYSLFSETINAGVKAGADIVLIETFSDAYELKAAVLAAKENCDLPIIASVTLDEHGRMLTGGGVDAVVALLEGLRVDVIGFNCGFGPAQLTPHVEEALRVSSTPILLMPNAGLPVRTPSGIQYDIGPEAFAGSMLKNARNGVWLLGGCCGTTPLHIEALVHSCGGTEPPEVVRKKRSVASSYGKTVVFGEKPIIIGERINPTGKPRLKEALRSGDYDFALREGITQIERNADLLDVNAGVPGIDEAVVLTALVERVQSVIDAPLQIDTANIDAMARAMRTYNGKPVINSVNGKRSSMDAVFPLVQKYGGIVVALTLDENGIPDTAEGRVDIAKKILARAEDFGIEREAFLFDPLTLAVSAGKDSALVTLECVRRLGSELGVKTSLGVSNVSFGLPARETLNAVFLSLALEAGLSAAILNPNSEAMHRAIKAHAAGERAPRNAASDALLGRDENFERYIAACAGKENEAAPKAEQGGMTLGEAVLKGLKREAANAAAKSIEREAPLEIIEGELIPALNTAGERFEKGTMYLPQLLMCAEAAKSAFTLIRGAMGGEADDTLGTIVLATVEGDIHDIGKNIVRALLENYRFRVVDLGKDVPAQRVVDAVKTHNARLAGLSALMTTTLAGMEKTIRLLREASPDCRIMCGGAVLTEEYARQIGADRYAKDAMAAVRYAQTIFTKP